MRPPSISRRAAHSRKLGVVVISCLTIGSSAVAREWTDVRGRKVEAEIVRADADKVFLKVGSREVPFEVSRLSPEDQEYIDRWLEDGASGTTMEDEPQEKTPQGTKDTADFDADVPDKTGPPADFEAKVVSEDADAGIFAYSSPHFRFYSNRRLTSRVIRGFSQLYEATYDSIKALPWGTKLASGTADGLFEVHLFLEEEEFLKAGGIRGSAGTAVGSKSLVQMKYLGVRDTGSRLILEDTEGDTVVIHELTHALRDHADRGLPTWAVEAFAEYVASAPYRRTGTFSFKDRLGDVTAYIRNRGAKGGTFHYEMSLEELLNANRATFYKDSNGGLGDGALMSYSSGLLALTYFWHADQGKDDKQKVGGPIRAWLAAIKGGKKEKEARELLLDGRSYKEIEEGIQRCFRRDVEIFFK